MLVLVLCISAVSVAQNTVRGTIVDESSLGVPGVSILEKGTSKGTVTDIEGNYSLSVGDDAVLIISYVGYEMQEIAVEGRSTIDVTLQEDLEQLEEVIVVGYGTRKKSHNTGAIAQVGGEDVAAIQVPRVDDALAGKMPGVLIQNQSGEPGADPRIQIRAASSLSGDSNPLIVVDGYPISGSLATVNPNDIESIEVLKDAASAAIYGSRGANGVILVTTKKGRGGLSFSYNGYTSWSRKYVDDIEMLKTAGEWASDLQTDAYNLSEVDPELANYRLNAYRDAPDVVSMEDWLFREGMTQSHDISMRGGSDEVKVFASVGYLNTKGIVQKQGFERYNGRLNVDANLSDKFKAGLSFNGFIGQQELVPHDMRDLLRAYSIHPIYHTDASIAFVQALNQQAQSLGLTPFDEGYRGSGNIASSIYDLQPGDIAHDWHYGRSENGIGGTGDSGPAAKLDYAESTQRTYFANAYSYLQYSIIDGLNIKTVLGADLSDMQDYYWRGVLADSQERSNQSALDQIDTKRSSVLSETTLSFDKSFGDHELSAVAGLEFQNFFITGTTIRGTNLPIDLPIDYSFLEPSDITVSERDETISRRSVFGRINYAYADRYLASVSLRRDGDSRFGENNRFETFPAVSLGWNIHNESFFNSNFISNLKLRFSRGTLGTTSFLGAYDALSLLSTQPTALGTGFLIPENIANENLTWQSNTETNFGFDIGLNGNRFTLSVDYYTSDIEDMLINQSVSEVLGTPSVVLNRGDVQSSGIEFSLGAVIIEKSDFNWNVNANLSTVNSEITSLGDLEELPRIVYGGPSGRGPQWRNYVGGEIGEMWGLEVIGEVESEFIADPTENIGINSSEYYVVDQNNDGEINEDDFVKLGSNTPDFYWGLNSQMNYRNFDFSFQFQGSQGAEVYNIDPIYWQSQFGGRVRESFDENDDGIADHNGEFYTQTRFAHGALVQDASFIALRNLTVGYTFNPEWVAKVGLTSVRVYTAATNLLYLFSDDYTSFNPEGVETTNSGYLGPTTYGYQEGASPIARSFTLGLNVNF
uniref:TonB-dependent receptor n=1 Tax=Roseihalotalea indica TaxID=2867963 RepID=A0AA49Q0Q9_9BACT|nr:TonB-dependent receptor [Tunicatimonas sp. TK19036]WKN40357.1 TonB-dependent receptor [Tunicatimonas sp. TK19036]